MNVDTAQELRVLSCCAGGAGLDLAAELAIGITRTVCWVEWEDAAIEYLVACMEAGLIDSAPLWTDIRTFDGKPWRGKVDLLLGGYPCQPFSLSGNRLGEDDPRHLWPHFARITIESECPILFFENVPGHLSLGLDIVCQDLQAMDYQVAVGLFTTQEVGGSQKRERVFILAVANSHVQRLQRWGESIGESPIKLPSGEGRSKNGEAMGDSKSFMERKSHDKKSTQPRSNARPSSLRANDLFPPGPDDIEGWIRIIRQRPELAPAKPKVRGMADGLAQRRILKLLGNGVVPLQGAYALCSLWAALFHGGSQ